MSAGRPLPSQPLPTLTEALWDAPPPAANALAGDPAALAEQLLGELQARLEPELAERVRAAMAPAVERAVERLLHETRQELARVLRAEVARALRQALGSGGHPPPA